MTTDDEEHRRTTAPIRHLHRLSVFLLLFSTAFWIWAFINNLRYDYVDGGVISFAAVMLSSMFVLCVIHHGGHGRGFRWDHADNDMGGDVDDEESAQDETNITASLNEPSALEAIQGSSPCKRRTMFIVPISSSLLVTLNYALGSVLTEHLWGKLYCGIFTGLWFILAVIQFILTRRVFRIADNASTRRSRDHVNDQGDDSSGMEGLNSGGNQLAAGGSIS